MIRIGYETSIGYNDLKTNSGVYFFAKNLPRETLGQLSFTDITTNIGGALGTNGIFTSPVSGIYSFQLNVNKVNTPKGMWATLRKNTNIEVGSLFCTTFHEPLFCAVSVILKLYQGETINGLVTTEPARFAHFSGFLIEQHNLI